MPLGQQVGCTVCVALFNMAAVGFPARSYFTICAVSALAETVTYILCVVAVVVPWIYSLRQKA